MLKAALEFEKRLLMRAVSIGRRPDDDDNERVRKAVLALFSLFMAFGAPFEVYTAIANGRPAEAVFMGVWTALTLAGLVHFGVTGKRVVLQTSQLAMTVIVPVLGNVQMGGFSASNGIILWGSLAPLGALLLCSRWQALGWLMAYLVAAGAVLALDDRWAAMAVERSAAETTYAVLGLVLGLTGIVFVLVWYFVHEIEQARAALAEEHRLLEQEQAKSERLLLNILPAPIARRLKDDGRTIADGFAHVTVLFADIVGFTVLSSRVSPADLVAMLNRVFSAFDVIAERHGVEKIKTIGDAYMAAAGLPAEREGHADSVAAMALEMQTALAALNAELGTELDIRIGIHSGPVVAGVIGKRKFIYDLWGDSVNTASRMESHGEAGRVQVSEATRELLGDRWQVEPRGEIEVKGKGAMKTFFLLGQADATTEQ